MKTLIKRKKKTKGSSQGQRHKSGNASFQNKLSFSDNQNITRNFVTSYVMPCPQSPSCLQKFENAAFFFRLAISPH